MIAAPDVDDGLPVVREGEVGQLLAVVIFVWRDAPCFEVGAVGRIDVAHAALVEGPRDSRAGWRRDEIVGKGIVENLLHAEGGAAGLRGDRTIDSNGDRGNGEQESESGTM